MKTTYKILLASLVLIIGAFVSNPIIAPLIVHKAKATAPQFMQSQSLNTMPSVSTNNCGTAMTATSSFNYISLGLGTTTAVMDTENCGYSQYGTDVATLLTQVTATTTSGVLTIAVDQSQDGVDWYGVGAATSTAATVTQVVNGVYNYVVATSTADMGATASTSIQNISLTFNTPLRYIRARYYILSGTNSGAKLAIWPQWVAKKQSR